MVFWVCVVMCVRFLFCLSNIKMLKIFGEVVWLVSVVCKGWVSLLRLRLSFFVIVLSCGLSVLLV